MDAKKFRTNRGFQTIEFKDRYANECSLQQSSLADCSSPGAGAVWLGIDNPKPQIMAVDAKRLGIDTKGKDHGWVPYEGIPEEVQLSTRMHLDSEQVKWLIEHLQGWLANGKFPGKFAK